MVAATVDDYLAGLPEPRRERLAAMRAAVLAGAPEATETIAYGMPALRSHGGRFLVSYDAYKAHDSLFPASDAVATELGNAIAPYLAGKGTIRFPANRPLPTALITRIVAIRFRENAAAEAAHRRR